MLSGEGIECTVANARFAKPLDEELILKLIGQSHNLLTVEENTLCGGFGSAVVEMLANKGITGVKMRCLGIPDEFVEHGPPEMFRSLFNIDPEGITRTIRKSFPELFCRLPVRIQEGK